GGMTTEWKIGDRLRILDVSEISAGAYLTFGNVYEVIGVQYYSNAIVIVDDDGDDLLLIGDELKYVERVFADEDTSQRNAELGEPSPECNCSDIADIREELTDIKSMIGRLLQREQAEVDALYAHRLNGVKFATGDELADKASAIIDGE